MSVTLGGNEFEPLTVLKEKNFDADLCDVNFFSLYLCPLLVVSVSNSMR